MKVFISWSGERSKQVAELFKWWLKCVIQACEPWVSTQDIDSGSIWFTEIGSQLSDTSVGIICLTNENKDRPWILFEAGALTKGLSTARVIPFLVDLTPQNVNPPLAELNMVSPDREGVLALVRAINKQLKDQQLPAEILLRVFDTNWPQFQEEFARILQIPYDEEVIDKREESDILTEILLTVRNFDKRIRAIETTNLPQTSFINKTHKYMPLELINDDLQKFIQRYYQEHNFPPDVYLIENYILTQKYGKYLSLEQIQKHKDFALNFIDSI